MGTGHMDQILKSISSMASSIAHMQVQAERSDVCPRKVHGLRPRLNERLRRHAKWDRPKPPEGRATLPSFLLRTKF